jgi:rubredoxin-NAD+ reductase
MPVSVKTPACPVVVSPPPAGDAAGRWIVEQEGNDVQAEFRNEAGDLLGYALTGAKVANKVALNKELPAIMP